MFSTRNVSMVVCRQLASVGIFRFGLNDQSTRSQFCFALVATLSVFALVVQVTSPRLHVCMIYCA